MKKPTPTTHGAWRVIDGQLVNESEAGTPVEQVAEPVMASTDERVGGPGIAVPDADKPNPPAPPGRKNKTQTPTQTQTDE